MNLDIGSSPAAGRVLESVDLDRAVALVQEVCRIPSVLGEEGALAEFLASVMADSGFEDVSLQPVIPDRPNAIGEVRFREGRRVVFTGHMDTKPVSHGWSVTEPFSGALVDGSVYGHGVMDMKAALACQIVAIEAVRASGLELSGTLAMAAVSDHMGDQLGSIAYFAEHRADLCVLGELTGNEVCLGHRGRYYFDITTLGDPRTPATSPSRSTRTSWRPRPFWRSTHRSTSRSSSRGSSICSGPRRTSCPGASTEVSHPAVRR